MTKVITFGAWKGGVGKTTMVFNLSVLNQTKKILLIDIDPQCNLTNCFIKDTENSNCLSNPIPIKTKFENIDIIPSCINLINKWNELETKNIIQKYKNNYDYIIFDTPPNLNKAIIQIYDLSDEIYLITDASSVSFHGLLTTLKEYNLHINNAGLKNNIKGIILNNLNRFKLTNEFIDSIEKNIQTKDLLIKPYIYKWSSVYKTLIYKQSIAKMHDKKAHEPLLVLSKKIIK